MTLVTSSWDDGHILDRKLVDILDRYGLKGTFYVAETQKGIERLSDEEIRELATRHEVGAHTLNHLHLTKLSLPEAKEEIFGSKVWVETVTGKPCETFCYPAGQYNDEIKEIVAAGGFLGARTTEAFSLTPLAEPFAFATTIQVYPFPFRKLDPTHYYWGRLLQPFWRNFRKAHALGVPYTAMHSWLTLAKAAFDQSVKKGIPFHVWGHSWEIERYGLWKEFEALCAYIGRRPDCTYGPNRDLLR